MHSQCTYRYSTGRKAGKRILYKAEMHCQHKLKDLTPKQKQKAANAKSKNARKVPTRENRQKKTARLVITVKIPSKRDLASISKPYLVSHPTAVQCSSFLITIIQFIHHMLYLFVRNKRSFFWILSKRPHCIFCFSLA